MELGFAFDYIVVCRHPASTTPACGRCLQRGRSVSSQGDRTDASAAGANTKAPVPLRLRANRNSVELARRVSTDDVVLSRICRSGLWSSVAGRPRAAIRRGARREHEHRSVSEAKRCRQDRLVKKGKGHSRKGYTILYAHLGGAAPAING